MVQEKIPFKGISYLDIWQPFCSAECNYLCNFGREYQQEQFCEFILNLGQWFRRCLFNDFLSGALATRLYSGAEPFMQFKEGTMGNIGVNLYENRTSASGDAV